VQEAELLLYGLGEKLANGSELWVQRAGLSKQSHRHPLVPLGRMQHDKKGSGGGHRVWPVRIGEG